MDFKNAKELFDLCQRNGLTISEIMRQRELSETESSPEELYTKMKRVLERPNGFLSMRHLEPGSAVTCFTRASPKPWRFWKPTLPWV